MRLLFIDDHPAERALFDRRCNSLGSITMQASLAGAETMIMYLRFNLIITDLNLGQHNTADQVIHCARNHKHSKNKLTPIIVVSSTYLRERVMGLKCLPQVSFEEKPVHYGNLVREFFNGPKEK